jgi:glutathione S-transferase
MRVPTASISRISKPGGHPLPFGSLLESAAICEDIDEMQASPKLHPADPPARAQHRACIKFSAAVLAELWELEASLVAQT